MARLRLKPEISRWLAAARANQVVRVTPRTLPAGYHRQAIRARRAAIRSASQIRQWKIHQTRAGRKGLRLILHQRKFDAVPERINAFGSHAHAVAEPEIWWSRAPASA